MKYCNGCNTNKLEIEFAWKNKALGKRQSRCRSCQSIAQADWYQSNKSSHKTSVAKYNILLREAKREYVARLKESTPCADCGRLGHFAAMDFDHLKDKTHTISKLTNNASSISQLMQEIAKCEIVCAYCHRVRTYNRMMN